MILYLTALGLAVIALIPLAWRVLHAANIRLRRDAAVHLHRAQLAELDRDLALGRVPPDQHAAAKLEIERRLLASDALTDLPARAGGAWVYAMLALIVPLGAVALYGIGGHPESIGIAPPIEQQSRAADTAQAQQDAARDEAENQKRNAAEVEHLHKVLPRLTVGGDPWVKAMTLLGEAEAAQGNFAQAVEDWHKLLAVRFEPNIAAVTAEVMTHLEGRITPEAVALWRRALAEAPPDAPWRARVEARLAQAPVYPLAPPPTEAPK